MDNQYQPDSTKSVEFNQALFEQRRLDDSKKNVNQLSLNPLAFNEEYSQFNYIVMFNEYSNTVKDIFPKLNDTEKKLIISQRSTLKEYISLFPVWVTKKQKVYPFSSSKVLNKPVWKIIENALYQFGLNVELLMESHGYSPNKKNPKSALMEM